MKILKRAISLGLIGFSLLILYLSAKLGVGTPGNPKAGFLPLFVSVVLFSLSASVLVMEMKKSDEEETKRPLIVWKNLSKPACMVLMLCGYAFLLPIFGYLISSFLIVFLMLSIFEPRKLWVNIVIAAVVSNLTFLVFYKGFKVLLPAGIFHLSW